ncbi:hypothetical protein B6C99_05705, partial [Gilliamella sp. N-G2]
FYSIQKLSKPKWLLIFLYLAVVPCTYGLSSFTVNVIQGNSPKVDNVRLAADNHGFTVNKVFYSESTGNIKEDEIKEFDGNLTLNDFVIKQLNYQSLDNQKNYQDDDGDNIDPVQPFLTTTTTWQWLDANGVKISDKEQNNIIGCGSGYPMPLRLEILNQIQAISQYGIPRKSGLVTLKKAYKIAVKPQICYAKPNSTIISPEMQWLTNNQNNDFSFDNDKNWWNMKQYSVPHVSNGGGYTSDYVPDYGYKVTNTLTGKLFPTSGFKGAQFQLLMSGAQSDYTFSVPVNPGGKVTIDKYGNILLNDKPSGKVTVRATYKKNTSIKLDYSFDPRSNWVIPYDWAYNWWNASGYCKLLTRAEFTNSPRNKAPQNWLYVYNAFTRAIDGSILGEWGPINKKNYPQSNWADQLYWTSEYWGSLSGENSAHFRIGLYLGDVGVGVDTNGHYVACKG